jgi:hypothetical protein
VCGSFDKQKGQHLKSDKHKAFLAKVTAELARAPPVQDAGGAAEIRDEDDPLAAENLGLIALSRPNPQSVDKSSDSESSDNDCDDSMPHAGGGAAAGLRSRSPSTTPLRRQRTGAGEAVASSSSPPTTSRQNRRVEAVLSPSRYVRFE